MKVICDREKLSAALAIVNTVIPSKSTKPVLENVCFVAKDDTLELVGTDLECSVRYTVEGVQVIEPGPVVVPARVTLDFVRDLSGASVHISTTEGNCVISGGDDRCELVTIDPDEYPVISRFGDEETFSIQGGNFTKLVNRTAFAAAREPGRYAMHGVLAEIEDGTLKFVATDGRRLALSSIPIETKSGAKRSAIVPTKGMQVFCRGITDPLEQVKLFFGDNQVGLKAKNAEIFARLIDGEYPRYAAVIPKDSRNMLEADLVMLTKKLRLVANVTGNDARAVRFKLGKNELELFGQSVGRGEAQARLEVDFKGEPSEIAFNPDFVLDGLKNCEESLVRLQFNDKTSPGKFTLGESYVYVVMPITIDA